MRKKRVAFPCQQSPDSECSGYSPTASIGSACKQPSFLRSSQAPKHLPWMPAVLSAIAVRAPLLEMALAEWADVAHALQHRRSLYQHWP
jgi:hypothetical protein